MAELDKKEIKRQTEKLDGDWGNLDNLGKRFLEDKKKIENEMEKVMDAKISNEDKKDLLDELENLLGTLTNDYNSKVTEKAEKIKESQKKINDDTKRLAEKFSEQKDSLNNVHIDVTSRDTKDAAFIAGQKQKELESLEKVNRENLESRIKYMQNQQSQIKERTLSRRR